MPSVDENEITYLVNVFDGANIVESVARIMVIREFPGAEIVNPLMDSSIGDEQYDVNVELVDSRKNENVTTIEVETPRIDFETAPMMRNIERDEIPIQQARELSAPIIASSPEKSVEQAKIGGLSSFDIFLIIFKFVILSAILALMFFSFYLFIIF